MRIAYVCADLGVPVFGRKGCSNHVQEVLRAFVARGATIDLFAMRCDGDPPPGLQNVRLHPLPTLPKTDCAARERAALTGNADTQALLEREGPFDLVYERYSLWSFAGMEYAHHKGTPGLLEVNAPLIDEQAEYRTLIDRAAAEQVAERVFRAATALVAVSDELAAYLRQHPAADRRVHVVPNGVDPERFSQGVAPALSRRSDIFTIGFVGTLKPWHGLSTLAEAFALLRQRGRNVRLLIVGDGPGKTSLEASLSSRGLSPWVHFAGAVAASDVPGWLASMDAAVAPYPELPRFYFSPLKVYEYMAAGLPVVASRIGQLAELIQDGVNGVLVPPGASDGLAAELEALLLDPARCRRLGREARATILGAHTWDAVARRILGLAGLPSKDALCTTSWAIS